MNSEKTSALNVVYFLSWGLLLCVALALAACGGSSSSTSNQPLEITGSWLITVPSVGTVTASVVSSACSVTEQGIQFKITVPGVTNCFIAQTGSPGSLTYSGAGWNPPPVGFLLGLVGPDPVPANQSANIGALFVQWDGAAELLVADATGTVQASTKSISGSYVPDPNSPIQGNSGTFTAVHQ